MTDTDGALADVDEYISESYALRRTGGSLGLGTENLYVARDGEETIRVALDNIVEVQYDSFDWFLTIVSVALVGFGAYSTRQNLLGGVAFAVAGVVSLYLTYRKRGKLSFKVSGRAKPLDVYPERPEAAYEALRPFMADERRKAGSRVS